MRPVSGTCDGPCALEWTSLALQRRSKSPRDKDSVCRPHRSRQDIAIALYLFSFPAPESSNDRRAIPSGLKTTRHSSLQSSNRVTVKPPTVHAVTILTSLRRYYTCDVKGLDAPIDKKVSPVLWLAPYGPNSQAQKRMRDAADPENCFYAASTESAESAATRRTTVSEFEGRRQEESSRKSVETLRHSTIWCPALRSF